MLRVCECMMMAYLFGVDTWMDTAHCISHFADDTKLEGWIICCKKGEVSPVLLGRVGWRFRRGDSLSHQDIVGEPS